MHRLNCLPPQQGEFVHAAWYKQHSCCAVPPHMPPFWLSDHPRRPPVTHLTLLRTCLQLQEHEELQYSRITPKALGQPSPLTLVWSMVLGEQQEDFAKAAQLLQQYWHGPTNRQVWKQCRWATIILSVPFKHCSQKSWPRGC